MKKILAVLIMLFSTAFIAVEADAAKRLGGGKNVGTQRNVQQQATPKAPAAAGATAQQPAAAAAPAGNKWLGPLAGLALGAGLMALFMNNGMAGGMAGLLLIAAIAGIGFMVFRALRSRGTPAPMQYAGNAGHTGHVGHTTPEPVVLGGSAAAAPHSVAATTASIAASRWPADFNAEEFVRHARLNFVRLQTANDTRDRTALADFLTPDMLTDVQEQWRVEGDAQGKTEVVTLESEVLDVVNEGLLYIVSVRFSGLIREATDSEAQPFAEIWHLEKPMRGTLGWLVSGIQQV